MQFFQILASVILYVPDAIAAPHSGMIDLPDYRDTGLLYPEINFSGIPAFVMENRNQPECLPINPDPNGEPQGINIASVQVCKPVSCTFYTGSHCEDSEEAVNLSVGIIGPGDAAEVVLPDSWEGEHVFHSMICGPVQQGVPNGGLIRPGFIVVLVPHVGVYPIITMSSSPTVSGRMATLISEA
ncbi:hypothetical protein K504DRAFT_489786 [Pleomassaria siparia CBS 279.74]|uniref:Uncharacterized protein n=1 Tax=Pleomassaria siparia CBS 279.74 TaxID=1314801 RepID=A0A6G1KDB9_9PLEO|nr:hypothetical protein K504DRAFT_489786 [Pleomassaria siparia CBS 279.74]